METGRDSFEGRIIPTPDRGEWKTLIDRFAREHPVVVKYDKDRGFMAPRLVCVTDYEDLAIQLRNIVVLPLGDTAEFSVKVGNAGNGVSYFAYVELYECPQSFPFPLKECRLSDYRIKTINPGQTVNVALNWTRTRAGGTIIAACFDPFFDPLGIDTVDISTASSSDHCSLIAFYEHLPRVEPF